ncbi:MAG TPA: Gfo/Idh/MocA family oxidoreductase [Candidatus Paceibacterota bacterium]|nr:Gfo/Idh/MocA family oxidoreductase [Verrucomicrobiota bacterium]HRY51450.1 Gfo/Idh/MocA family oxidoreductase [Candidatus Paceibacterota bacterium]HRZ99496.1 Gfo/Idh/MocA family oxidoreductase [Candidatus Paceibacterota bacterium]
MNRLNRRSFLSKSVFATAGSYWGLTAYPYLLASPGSPANEVRLAVAGIRSQGNGHVERFQKLKGVKVVALCDPDRQILNQRLQQFKKQNQITDDAAIQGYADVRKALDRKDIDAIVIATPNHWHALIAIWACQAGKHVYVEKPVSHSIWEGRKIVEAARKYNRIVQAGTQQRSCRAVQEAARDVQAGKYGKVLWLHCSKLSARTTIGKVTEPQPVPDHIDYNLWAGPAPMTPVMRKQFHYDWHWQWPWGDGEMGNWGIHYIDDARHILGWNDVPTKVIAAGNRFAWDDNGQTPNMHFALFDYDGLKMVVDIRNLSDPGRPGDEEGALYLKSRGGNYIQCENAVIRLARGGGAAYDKEGKRIHQYQGDGGGAHGQNFIDAIRSGHRQDLAAEIEVGHFGTAICHQANIAYRVGAAASIDQVRESMKSHEDAVNTLQDMLEQLKGNQVDLAKTPFMVGPQLTYDRQQERFVGANAEQANPLLKVPYRDGFVVPDKV